MKLKSEKHKNAALDKSLRSPVFFILVRRKISHRQWVLGCWEYSSSSSSDQLSSKSSTWRNPPPTTYSSDQIPYRPYSLSNIIYKTISAHHTHLITYTHHITHSRNIQYSKQNRLTFDSRVLTPLKRDRKLLPLKARIMLKLESV